MLADKLGRHIAAALEGHIGDLGAGSFLDRNGNDLVFLLGAGTAHLVATVAGSLDVAEIILGRGLPASPGTHNTNSSSAIILTGVKSFQLKGMPVASGVVKRLESVMMILCGSLAAP